MVGYRQIRRNSIFHISLELFGAGTRPSGCAELISTLRGNWSDEYIDARTARGSSDAN